MRHLLALITSLTALVALAVIAAPVSAQLTPVTFLRTADGTAAMPPYAFVGDPTTGFFRVSAGSVGAASSGTQVWSWSSTGLTLAGSNALTLTTGNVAWSGRSLLSSTANGVIRVGQASGASPTLELNSGTAVPTVTSCGTGAVTTKSTNIAGEVTATGASACTLTFGLPNWTNTPFCVIEDESTIVATDISAISVSAFTVSGLTSGDKFTYICLGGQ